MLKYLHLRRKKKPTYGDLIMHTSVESVYEAEVGFASLVLFRLAGTAPFEGRHNQISMPVPTAFLSTTHIDEPVTRASVPETGANARATVMQLPRGLGSSAFPTNFLKCIFDPSAFNIYIEPPRMIISVD